MQCIGTVRASVLAAFLISIVFIPGCGHQQAVPHPVASDVPGEGDRSLLAGEWQYEDGAVVTLRLDEQGNGSYAWKDGRFETTRLSDRTWAGKWYQRENDREGGFIVKLSEDYTEGEGTWWYIRIGDDRAPVQRGGSFHLSKRTSLTNLSDTPASP